MNQSSTMDEGPPANTIQSLDMCDNENSVLVKEGLDWARLTRPKKRDVNFCIILTCLGVVTAMAIIAYIKITVDIKELRNSVGNIVGTDKSANESEIAMPAGQSSDYRIEFNSEQKIKTYDLHISKEIKQLQASFKKVNTELQSLKDSQIASTQKLIADSVKTLKASLLSELQNVKPNDSQIASTQKLNADSLKALKATLLSELQGVKTNDSQLADNLKLTTDSVKILNASLSSQLQNMQQDVARISDKIQRLEESLSTLGQTLQKHDSQIASNQELNADLLKALKASLLSELADVKLNDSQIADNLKWTTDSVKILNASLSSQLQNMQQNAITMQESLSDIRRTFQTLRETDSQIVSTQKLNADSLKALKASLLSDLQHVRPNVARISDKIQKLEESLSTLGQTLQKHDSEIASTQKLNADSLNALKASLLSELQDVKLNVARISDKVQKLEESLSTLGQTLQKHDYQIVSTQKLNADSIKALKASLLSELKDVKPNVARISDKIQKLEQSLSTVRQTLQKYARNLCPEHWILLAGKCYFFSTSKENFANARKACQSSLSNMVVINSRMEQDFLVNQADSQFYWIGLTDMINEGVWRWEDGTSYLSTPNFWKPDQPDNYKNSEDCVHFAIKGLWNDDYCTAKYKYICEKMAI